MHHNLIELPNKKSDARYFILDDGRIGAIYPTTGYVRVSYAMSKKQEYRTAQWRRTVKAIEAGNVGRLLRYQINPKRIVKTMHRYNQEVYRKFRGNMYAVDQPLYYEYEGTERVKFPGDTDKLMSILINFNAKNCQV